MIKVSHPKDCCGCSACAQICPRKCIDLRADKEGFLYPVVNKEACTSCGLCEKACPVINQSTNSKPVLTLAAINMNHETRLQSSSGGIFSLLAEETINKDGVVFGAAFNKNWEVEHIYIEGKEHIDKLRGSKYVQSRIGESYKQAKAFLNAGREVLFSGTPCQIAGLKKFLRKDYNNLKTVDVVCHGTPSPKVWRKYLEEVSLEHNVAKITNIQFRCKTNGWKNYSLTIKHKDRDGIERVLQESFGENIFMKCFLNNLCLRPSCYACPARDGKSGSDITLADLWGTESICPDMDDDKGTSLVLLRNKDFELPNFNKKEIEYKEALKYNPSIETDVNIPGKRNKFFKIVTKQGVHKATIQCTTKSKVEVLKDKIIWNIKNRILK